MGEAVANDMVVGIEYVLKLGDGAEVDRSDASDPLEYLHGHQNIIPGLESQIAGMKVGESKDAVVKPDDAYGDYDPERVEEVERDRFPPGLDLQEGTMLEVGGEGGGIAIVKSVAEDAVTLDFNHPLAGQTLHFSVKVVSLRDATQEEMSHGHAHGAHSHH